jgi:hypothetical protein
MRSQNLDRDGAVEPRIPGPIHFSHPASAERRDDFIRTQLGALRKRNQMMALDRFNGTK